MKKSVWWQPGIGFALLVCLLIPMSIYELTQNGQTGIKVTGMMTAGTFLGYVLSRASFGFTGPIKKLTQNGDGRQAKALIYLFMITSVIGGVAIIGLGTRFFSYPLTTPLGVGTIVGGLLFGAGMMLSTGCASGTLSDIGDGLIPAVVVLVFFMLGSVFGVTFYGSSADINFTPGGSSISGAVGSVSLGVIINLGLLLFMLGVVVVIHKYRALRKTQILTPLNDEFQKIDDLKISTKNNKVFENIFTYKTWERLFKKRWTWMTGVLGLTIWFSVIALGFKETPGITGAYARWGIFLTHGFGLDKTTGWAGYYGGKDGPANFMVDAQTWQNIGIIFGALAAKLFANDFKLMGQKNQKWHNWVLYAIGGLFMGLGARLARGCNFGALFTGVSYQTGFGWVFGIGLTISSTLTAMLIKVMRHETPAFVYKIKRK